MKSSKSTTPSMNHSSEASHIDNYDEENTNTSSSTVDFSLLRKPIVTSVTGFSEAKKAYDSGTEEVISRLLFFFCSFKYILNKFPFSYTQFYVLTRTLSCRFVNCWPTNVISYTNVRCVEISFVHSSTSYHTNVSIARRHLAQIIIFILVVTDTL